MLKIGIVGFGGAGMAQYGHFYSLGCPVTAVFDPHAAGQQRARNFSGGMLVTGDFDQFLAADLDAVSICSPDRTHADYYARSLRAGKHTIAEKPLTDSLDGCREILAAMRERPDCVAATQHQMRFLPVHLEMRRLLQARQLGQLSYLEGYYIHNLTQRASLYDRWRFEDNATPLIYSGCHFVDLLRWLLDDEVVEVSGMANNLAFPEYPESDTNITLLRFRSGVIGKVITAFGFGRPQDHSVRIYGNERCIENNLLFAKDGSFSVFARPAWPPASERPAGLKPRLRFWRSAIKTMLLSRVAERLLKTRHLLPDYSVAAYPQRMYEHRHAVRESLRDFVGAVQERRPPLCSALDAARTVATCLAGVEAYRTGRTVAVADYWLPEFGPTPVRR